MRCLTIPEQQEWLSQQNLVEQPYANKTVPQYYIQFYAPRQLRAIQAFTHHLTDLFWVKDDALVTVNDWPLYQPYEMRIIDCIRFTHGEKRWLIDASGHLFSAKEKDDLIGLFSLSVGFEWTAYLYFPYAKVTLLNWEGEIFDFWTDEEKSLSTISKVLDDFKLERTKNTKRR